MNSLFSPQVDLLDVAERLLGNEVKYKCDQQRGHHNAEEVDHVEKAICMSKI